MKITHDRRYTRATLLLAASVPVMVVSERLRHAHATIMLGVYAHVIPGMQDVERPSGEVTVERVVLHRLGRDEAQLLFEFLQRARGADDAPVLVSEGEPT